MRKSVFLLLVLTLIFPFTVSANETKPTRVDLVNPHQTYSYEEMLKDIEELETTYPDLITTEVLATTKYERDIVALRLGKGSEYTVLVNASAHAREHMTTNLVMEMIDVYAEAYINDRVIDGYSVREELQKGTLVFVPMVNPDGVTLQQEGLKAFPKEVHNDLIKMNGGSKDFTRWKANAEGIDPNRSYPEGWERVRNDPGYPSWAMHKGPEPLANIESKTMAEFAIELDPEMLISYHSSGEILYWYSHTNTKEIVERDRKLAQEIYKKTNYPLVAPNNDPSGGGYKDWFVVNVGKPSFTIEIGRWVNNRHLDNKKEFPRAWEKNKSIGLWAINRSYNLWAERVNQHEEDTGLKPIMVIDKVAVYKTPHFATRTQDRLSAKMLYPVRKHGNWYQIKTYAGLRWVYASEGMLAEYKVMQGKLKIEKTEVLFEHPFRKETRLSVVSPQEVTYIGGYFEHGWYQIKTWLGDKWVYLPSIKYKES